VFQVQSSVNEFQVQKDIIRKDFSLGYTSGMDDDCISK